LQRQPQRQPNRTKVRARACPFVNLPETKRSRFGEELNAEKMKKAIWLRPETVAQIGFLEWTEGDRLRHSKFVGLGEDKDPRSVAGEEFDRWTVGEMLCRAML
jgi:ATP-dependent DNA ligase